MSHLTTISRNRDSEEYTRVEVEADVTLDMTVEMAVTARTAQPEGADWVTASWLGAPGTERTAQADPSLTSNLEPGTWKVWVRLTDNPEQPVLEPGFLKIT